MWRCPFTTAILDTVDEAMSWWPCDSGAGPTILLAVSATRSGRLGCEHLLHFAGPRRSPPAGAGSFTAAAVDGPLRSDRAEQAAARPRGRRPPIAFRAMIRRLDAFYGLRALLQPDHAARISRAIPWRPRAGAQASEREFVASHVL
jgi:hypothetical protein